MAEPTPTGRCACSRPLYRQLTVCGACRVGLSAPLPAAGMLLDPDLPPIVPSEPVTPENASTGPEGSRG